jgi:hypothetical protein
MAKCKLCKTDIPDGTEYCQNCQNKRSSDKANESYLDSLLNSVKNTSEPSEKTIRKKNKEDGNSNPAEKVRKASEQKKAPKPPNTRKAVNNMASGLDNDDLYRVDLSDLEDFDKFNFEADLQDIDNDIVISDEDLFGNDVSRLLNDHDKEAVSYDYKSELKEVVNDTIAHHTIPEAPIHDQSELVGRSAKEDENIASAAAIEPVIESGPEENITESEIEHGTEAEHITEAAHIAEAEHETETENEEKGGIATAFEEEAAENSDELNEAMTEEIMDNIIPQEVEELPEDSGLDLDLEELLNSLDVPETATSKEGKDGIHTETTKTQQEDSTGASLEDMFHNLSGEDVVEDIDLAAGTPNFEPVDADDEDFMKLLNQISGDDPVSGDLKAISDMMNNPQKDIKAMNMPSDVGEVFSDALTAVSSLKDFNPDEEDLSDSSSDKNGKASKDSKEKQVQTKNNAKKSQKKGKNKEAKPRRSLFQRLFGNVKNEKTAAQFAEESKKEEEAGVPGEKPKKEKGKKKGKKGAEAPAEDETVGSNRRPAKASEEDEVPVDKKAEKKKAKAEKKKAKQAIEVIDEIDEDPGRINRLGAAIVFIFFGALAAILILGTSIISYTLNIQHATDYFSKQKYTEAYYEVYGVELKDEDLELYEKIATVMFVNKQLNSYNNYYNIKQYPQALDSLLKGLKRYDKYIELATYLGVDSDLNYVREQILAELNKEFNLTEAEAVRINSITNMKDYSLAVYDVVLENMNK